ncbi:MAG: hypothetical protein PVJ61_01690 [Dehalococcoidia bacterium]|jgi:hypothetical protein
MEGSTNVIGKTRILTVLLAVILALCFSLLSAFPAAADSASCFVSTDGDNTNDGSSWQNAWRDIQYAIDQCELGATVSVAAGTYHENITLKDGVSLLGAGADVTTLDGGGNGTVVTAGGVGAETRFEGFTITNGDAGNGGGLHCEGSALAITDCVFSSNAATYGGAIYNRGGSTLTLTGCVFSANAATYGGAVYNYHSSPVITACSFSDNFADKRGGAVYNYDNSLPTLANCLFTANVADDRGGAVYNYNSAPAVTGSTFAGNEAILGSGLCNDGSLPAISNSILWDSGQEIYNVLSSPNVSYCDVLGGYDGEGNINTDPLFADAAAGDYRLSPESPCLDAGANALVPEGLDTDFEGDPRVMDGDGDGTATVDMGADEYYFEPPNRPPLAPASPSSDGEGNFSWSFADPDGDSQGAYRILVASVEANLAADNGDVWDSGKVESEAGEANADLSLAAGRTYYWAVKAWDSDGAEGPYCSPQQFTAPEAEPDGVIASTELTLPDDGQVIGDIVTIGIMVTNTSGSAGDYRVILKVGDEVKATKELTLGVGASESATFNVPGKEAGDYTVFIEGVNGSFTVTAPQVVVEPSDSSMRWLVVGAIVAVVVVLCLVLFFFVIKKRTRWAVYFWFR